MYNIFTYVGDHGQAEEVEHEARDSDEDLLPVAAPQHVRELINDRRDESLHRHELKPRQQHRLGWVG